MTRLEEVLDQLETALEQLEDAVEARLAKQGGDDATGEIAALKAKLAESEAQRERLVEQTVLLTRRLDGAIARLERVTE